MFAPHEDRLTWLKFASLSRKQGRLGIAFRVVEELRQHNPDPRVYVALAKNLFATGEVQRALSLLKAICSQLSAAIGLESLEHLQLTKLLTVTNDFPIAELMSLAEQMKSQPERSSWDLSSKRVFSPTLGARFATNTMLAMKPNAKVLEQCAELEIPSHHADMLLASCYLKVSSSV